MSHRYIYVPSLLVFPPTSHPIPSPRLSQSTSLSSRNLTANPHWLSVLHMVTYIFPCYSHESSYPPLLFLGPQVCSLCLHLHCCPANSSSVPSFHLSRFHIYALIMIFVFFLIYFTIIGSRFFFSFFFFLMWTIFKVFIEFVRILLWLYVLVFWSQGMWHLISLTRDRTAPPALQDKVLTIGPPGKSLPHLHFLGRNGPLENFLECGSRDAA